MAKRKRSGTKAGKWALPGRTDDAWRSCLRDLIENIPELDPALADVIAEELPVELASVSTATMLAERHRLLHLFYANFASGLLEETEERRMSDGR